MKRTASLLIIIMMMIMPVTSFATARYCGKCNADVQFKIVCNKKNMGGSNYYTCTKGGGCNNYYYQYMGQYECCKLHTSNIYNTPNAHHVEGTVHDVKSHNLPACKY